MQPVVIPVVQTWGTRQHLRYAVADTTGRYWTGSGWATRQPDALVYASHHDAAAAAHRILWKQFRRRHTVYQRYDVPLELQVFATTEVSPDDPKRFAKQLVKLGAFVSGRMRGWTSPRFVESGLRV